MRSDRRVAEITWLLILAGGAAFFMLSGLDRQPLADFDEGIHASVSLEMVQSGDWFSPTLAGQPYFRKPPLKLWLTAWLFRERGLDLWSVRLPSALSGIALAFLVGLWVRQWSGSRWQGLISGLAVASMRPIYFHAFRTGEMDGLLCFFVTATLYCWWSARYGRRPLRWMILLGAALGLGFMSKSVAALVPLLVIGFDLLLKNEGRRPGIRSWAAAGATFVVIAAPWHIAMSVLHGQHFWDRYFGVEVVSRSSGALFGANTGDWWYVRQIFSTFAPYAFWLVPALVWGVREMLLGTPSGGLTASGDERPAGNQLEAGFFAGGMRLFLWAFALVFVVVSAMETRVNSYLLAAYPAAVILIVHFLFRALPLGDDWLGAAGHSAALWSVAAFAPSVFLAPESYAALREAVWPPLLHPLALATVTALLIILGLRAFLHVSGWDRRRLGRILQVIVLATVLAAALGIYAKEWLQPRQDSALARFARNLDRTPTLWINHRQHLDVHPAALFYLLANPGVEVVFHGGAGASLAEKIPSAGRVFVLTSDADKAGAVLPHKTSFGSLVLWSR